MPHIQNCSYRFDSCTLHNVMVAGSVPAPRTLCMLHWSPQAVNGSHRPSFGVHLLSPLKPVPQNSGTGLQQRQDSSQVKFSQCSVLPRGSQSLAPANQFLHGNRAKCRSHCHQTWLFGQLSWSVMGPGQSTIQTLSHLSNTTGSAAELSTFKCFQNTQQGPVAWTPMRSFRDYIN